MTVYLVIFASSLQTAFYSSIHTQTLILQSFIIITLPPTTRAAPFISLYLRPTTLLIMTSTTSIPASTGLYPCVTEYGWFTGTELGKEFDSLPHKQSVCQNLVADKYSFCGVCLKLANSVPMFSLHYDKNGNLRHRCIRGDPDYYRDLHPSYIFAEAHISDWCTTEVPSKGKLCHECSTILAESVKKGGLTGKISDHFRFMEDGTLMATGTEYSHPFGKRKGRRRGSWVVNSAT